MRYVMAAIIALLVIALAVCAHFARKSRKTTAPHVAALIDALLLPVIGNLVIILSCNRILSTLGSLIYFFEYACGLSGYLLGVNPFDQPGVEAYKKNMFRMLGKPGA